MLCRSPTAIRREEDRRARRATSSSMCRRARLDTPFDYAGARRDRRASRSAPACSWTSRTARPWAMWSASLDASEHERAEADHALSWAVRSSVRTGAELAAGSRGVRCARSLRRCGCSCPRAGRRARFARTGADGDGVDARRRRRRARSTTGGRSSTPAASRSRRGRTRRRSAPFSTRWRPARCASPSSPRTSGRSTAR